MKKYVQTVKNETDKGVIKGKNSHHSRSKVDLAGQRFGKLTVLQPADNVDGRTAWLCRCDCGNEVIKKTVHLRSGHVITCGCVSMKDRLTLIDGTCAEILRSKTIRKNNTSGITGVEWVSSKNRWRATISFKGKRYYLGKFEKFEDAVKARKNAEEKLHDTFLKQLDEEKH